MVPLPDSVNRGPTADEDYIAVDPMVNQESLPIQDEPEGVDMLEIKHRVHDAEKLRLEAIGRFVAASEEIRFESKNRQQHYSWVERVLVQQEYGRARRREG
jgi:hypothetical protein